MDTCALCLRKETLQKSHVIPNAVFKRIFRNNNGQGIRFNDDKDSPIDLSSDSWWEYLLCGVCEPKLNDFYERYSLALFRGSKGNVSRHEHGVTFSGTDLTKLKMFLISIFWRAAVTNHPAYAKVYIPEPWREQIREAIHFNRQISQNLATVKINRLIDSSVDGFTLENLKNLIVTPFLRRRSSGFSLCFLIEGFFIEIFTPGLRYKKRSEKGVLNPENSVFMVPYLKIFEIPELVELMVSGYGKHAEGGGKH